MIVRDSVTGQLKVDLSHDEFMDVYRRWQQKPETKELIARLDLERQVIMNNALANVRAQKTK